MLNKDHLFALKRLKSAVVAVYNKSAKIDSVDQLFGVSVRNCRDTIKDLPVGLNTINGELERNVDALLGIKRGQCHQEYSEDNLQHAIFEITKGSITYNEAFQQYGVPENTLKRKRDELYEILSIPKGHKHTARKLCHEEPDLVLDTITRYSPWKGIKSKAFLTESEAALVGIYADESGKFSTPYNTTDFQVLLTKVVQAKGKSIIEVTPLLFCNRCTCSA